MMAISSSDLLNEFTIYADKVVDEKETLIVQRSSGKNIVVMSMEQFNELQKEIFLAPCQRPLTRKTIILFLYLRHLLHLLPPSGM